MKVEVAVLGSPSLISLMVSVDVNNTEAKTKAPGRSCRESKRCGGSWVRGECFENAVQ